ncbi:MAG: zinc-dependent alcohol dehydrogenase [Candidatus Njordarchaeia archaeon]
MRAAVLTKKGFEVKDVPVPQVGENDVLIRVMSAGICGTDLAIYKGSYRIELPRILGHEFAGVVEKVGENVEGLDVGERVTSEINVTCGKCYYCTHGMRTHCIHRKAIGISRDGAFAEYVVVPAENVHRLPQNIDFDQGTFVEPLAAAIQTFEMTPINKGNTVAIYGSGKMGLLILQVAKVFGAGKVIVIGRTNSKLELAKSLGADDVINVENVDPVKAVREETGGIGADIVVEATGNPTVLNNAIRMTRSRGIISVKSTHGLNVSLNLTEIVVRELRIQGSRCGNFKKSIEMLEKNKIQVKPLISAIYTLEKIEKAFKTALKKETIKIVLKP